MKFKMIHENLNVSDLDRSLRFYEEALDLHEVRRKTGEDFIIVYLRSDVGDFELELTWLKTTLRLTTWESVNSIWHFRRIILKKRTKIMRRWAAFALKMKPWASISSKTRMATGWRFCHKYTDSEQ